MKFNYYDYPKKETFKHPVKILDGGLVVKTEGNASGIDENGENVDYSITEVRDELVNLVYPRIIYRRQLSNEETNRNAIAKMAGESVGDGIESVVYSEDSSQAFINVNKNAGLNVPLDDVVSIPLIPAHKLLDNTITLITNIPISLAQSILEVSGTYSDVKIGISTLRSPMDAWGVVNTFAKQIGYGSGVLEIRIEGSDVDGMNGTHQISKTESKFIDGIITYDLDSYEYLSIKPSDTFPLSSLFLSIPNVNLGYISEIIYKPGLGVQIDTDMYAMCGLWGNSKNRKSFFASNKKKPYLTKGEFKQRIKSLATNLNDYGIDIIINPYLENLEELPGEPTTNIGPWIVKEIEYGVTPNKDITKWYVDKNYSFITRKKSINPTDNITFLTNPTINDARTIISNGLFGSSERKLTFGDVARAGELFVRRQNDVYEQLKSINTDDISPYNTSLREMLVARFGPKSKLLEELEAIEQDILEYTEENALGISADTFVPGDISKNVNLIRGNRVDDAIRNLREQVRNLRLIAVAGGVLTVGLGAAGLVLANFLDNEISKLESWRKRAYSFEYYTGESILSNGRSIGELNQDATPSPPLIDRGLYSIYPRLLIPVDMGVRKTRRRRKNIFGKHEWVKSTKDMGIRWCEVYFVNAFVHNIKRKSEKITGIQIPVNPVDNPLEWEIDSITHVEINDPSTGDEIETTLVLKNSQNVVNPGVQIFFEISDRSNIDSYLADMWAGLVLDEFTIQFNVPSIYYANNIDVSNLSIRRLIKPYEPTQPNPNPIPSQIEYSIPYLPSDKILRDLAFNQYGPIDQNEFATRWNDFKKISEYGIRPNSTEQEITNALTVMDRREPTIPGFEIFKETSDSITSLRSGIDIYGKVSFLLTILKDTFGSSRVSLIETTRSHEDQEVLQLGGPSSNFLSWHNYGLAVKILITEKDGYSPIVDGSDDYLMLINIAEGFTKAAYDGLLGNPCNVVWCARLKTGPNIFVWEFLPIGIDHKEAPLFRDAIYNQLDPIKAVAPVNVDKEGYVRKIPSIRRVNVPTSESDLDTQLKFFVNTIAERQELYDELNNEVDETELIIRMSDELTYEYRMSEKGKLYKKLFRYINPVKTHISSTSNAYENSYIRFGEHWVRPQNIPNYKYERNLILKDIQEFFFMVLNKFKANGTRLKDGQTVLGWKNVNPISFNQLVMFNSLIGNFDVVRSLLSTDYITRFEVLTQNANSNPVDFVRDFLGLKQYMNIKIYPDGIERDSGYITLHDGKASIAVLQCRSIQPEGHQNMFGEKQADLLTIEFGQIQNGAFIPEFEKDSVTGEVRRNPMDLFKSEAPVISGYAPDGSIIPPNGYQLNDGTIIPSGDAYILHEIIKDRIITQINNVKRLFNELKTEFLHDTVFNSPNDTQLLENEFGVISTQDLLSFDDLRDLYRRLNINNKAGSDTLGDRRGVNDPGDDPNRDQSIYEKLVSTTQFTGIQFSRNTNEKPTIEPVINERLEKTLKRIYSKGVPDVRDI